MPILDAFAGLKVKGKRRKGQTYHPQRINFFHARRFDGWVGVRGCLPAKRPPKRKSPTIVLADLRWRQEAFTLQTRQLFRLNRLCETKFRYHHEAINHAFKLRLNDSAEAGLLDVINNDGNAAKHEGLTRDSPTAMSRSVPVQPFRSFRI